MPEDVQITTHALAGLLILAAITSLIGLIILHAHYHRVSRAWTREREASDRRLRLAQMQERMALVQEQQARADTAPLGNVRLLTGRDHEGRWQ